MFNYHTKENTGEAPKCLHVSLKKKKKKILDYAAATAAKSLQLCQTLCEPIDGSLRLWRSPFQEAVFTYCFFRFVFTFDYPTGNLATIVKGRFWKGGIEMKVHSRFVFVIGFLFLKLGPRQP